MWMIVTITATMLIVASTLTVVVTNQKITKNIFAKTGYYDKNITVQNFSDRRGMEIGTINTTYRFESENLKTEREDIETILIRACRTVSTLAHANNCNDWDKASVVWGFVGNIGEMGSLDQAWSDAGNNVFNCTTFSDGTYGKSLIQQSLPKQAIVGKGFKYDFTGMDDTHVDPCGYIDIVRR